VTTPRPTPRSHRFVAAAVLALVALHSLPARAQDSEPPFHPPMASPRSRPTLPSWPPAPFVHNGFYYRNILAARVNPIGVSNDFRFGYRVRLYGALRDSFVAAGYLGLSGTLVLSPSFVRPGVLLEIQPLSILNLSVAYEMLGFFGTFNTTTSFATPMGNYFSDPFTQRARDNAAAAGGAQTALGHVVTLGALVQVRLGPLALRTNFRFVYHSLSLRAGTRYFYEPYLDILASNDGWVMVNETDVIYQTPFGLNIGARYTQTDAYYSSDQDPLGSGASKRLGPVFTFTFFERRRGGFNGPTIFVLSQWWLQHRYRNGAEQPTALPYLAFGLSFRGEF